MTIKISDPGLQDQLLHNLQQASRDTSDALAKLSSGQVFTRDDPRPVDRALADRFEQKLRGLAATKRSINDGISMLQTGEGGMNEISHMLVRMKELNTAAASSTISPRERRFLFVEYQALYNEIDRIARATEFNGIPLLNGADPRTPETLILRIGDNSGNDQTTTQNDHAIIRLPDMRSIVTTAEGLGLRDASELLQDGLEGLGLEAVVEFLEPEDTRFATLYDEALDKLAGHRAHWGALQNRLNRALDYHDVASENISAARSSIADVDYAAELGRLTQSRILMQTTSALLTQNQPIAGIALHLVQSLLHGS